MFQKLWCAAILGVFSFAHAVSEDVLDLNVAFDVVEGGGVPTQEMRPKKKYSKPNISYEKATEIIMIASCPVLTRRAELIDFQQDFLSRLNASETVSNSQKIEFIDRCLELNTFEWLSLGYITAIPFMRASNDEGFLKLAHLIAQGFREPACADEPFAEYLLIKEIPTLVGNFYSFYCQSPKNTKNAMRALIRAIPNVGCDAVVKGWEIFVRETVIQFIKHTYYREGYFLFYHQYYKKANKAYPGVFDLKKEKYRILKSIRPFICSKCAIL